MASRRLVFLDIDGVLNSNESRLAGRRIDFEGRSISIDPLAVGRLNRLALPGVDFVLSSTWRHMGLGTVQSLLATAGFVGRLIDATPLRVPGLGDPYSIHADHRAGRGVSTTRGQEIAAWLDANFGWTDAIAILDDDTDMDPVAEWLVLTDFSVGLQDEHVDAAAVMLGLADQPIDRRWLGGGDWT